MPRLNLPTFAGDPLQWCSLDEAFTNVVINNDRIADIDKFRLLKNHLQGAAAEAIANIHVSSANLLTCWEIIKTRFGKASTIIRVHVKNLLLSKDVSTLDYKLLRNFLNTVQINVRGLASLGVASDTY